MKNFFNVIIFLVMCVIIFSGCNEQSNKTDIVLSNVENEYNILLEEKNKMLINIEKQYIELMREKNEALANHDLLKNTYFNLENEMKKISINLEEANNELEFKNELIISLEKKLKELEQRIEEIIPPQKYDYLFNYNEINILDQISNMVVIQKTGNIKFKGATVVTGNYIHYYNHEFHGNAVQFFVSQESLTNLPKEENDTRIVWLLLDDYEKIKDIFGYPGCEGEATIIIDDYSIYYGSGEGSNSATLIHLVDLNVYSKSE